MQRKDDRDRKCDKIVAELADKVKMLESKALTMSVLVRHLAWDPLESTCRHASLSIL